MPAHPKLTDDQRQAIIDLKAAEPDIPNRAIPARLGLDVTHTTVQAVLKKAAPDGPGGGKTDMIALRDAAATGTGTTIPHSRLIPCPLNPRRTFDDGALQQLADSLMAFGGAPLQNLVVRPCPEDDGFYQILAGERRWRAAGLNIAAGHAPAGTPIPCKIVDADDEAALEIALVENDQREDVAPMEQAAGYAALRDLRRARDPALTERQFILDLAGRIGRSDAYVRLRLHWADRLCDAAKAALADGAITKEAARVLVMADEDLQLEALAQIEDGGLFDADDLREFITQDMPPLAWAIFDRAAYDGEFVEDPDAAKPEGDFAQNQDPPEAGWFKDVAQAMRLQREAIDALKARLEAENDWVEVIGMNQFFQSHLYREHMTDDGDEAPRGAVIDIAHGLGVTLHEGLARRPSHPEYVAKPAGDFAPNQNNPAAPTADPSDDNKDANAVRTPDENDGPDGGGATPPETPPPAPTGPSHYVHARNRKSMRLQRGVARDDKAAMALTCLALMGHQACCRIAPTDIHRDDTALDPVVKDTLEAFRKMLSPGYPGGGAAFCPPEDGDRTPLMLQNRGWGQDIADNPGMAELLATLLALNVENLFSLFRNLVARQVGSFCDGDAGPGDAAQVLALAHHLDLTEGREADHGLGLDPADLDGLRGPALDALARGMGVTPGKTAGQTRQAITDALRGLPFAEEPVLATLRFTDAETALAGLVGDEEGGGHAG